jgi:biopolymer transport protein ExbB
MLVYNYLERRVDSIGDFAWSEALKFEERCFAKEVE